MRLPLLRHCDSPLVLLGIFMSLFGIAFLFFSSFALSMKYTGDPFYFVKRQSYSFVLGLSALFFFSLIPLQWWYRHSEKIFIVILGLLFAVFIPGIGKNINNARRWLEFSFLPISVQPSELIKPFYLIVLVHVSTTANAVQRAGQPALSGKNILPGVCVLLVILLIALQPDISTAATLFMTSVAILSFNRRSFRALIGMCGLSLPFWIWLLQSKQYIVPRFSFLSPEADPHNSGYHIIRSLNAHRAGGWIGADNTAAFANLAKLPDAHNDFAFAAIVNTSGFIGGCIVIFCCFLFLERGLRIVKLQLSTQQDQGALLAFALTFIVTLETILHIAVTLGLLPTTGTPLPFFSYGGSSLIAHFAMLGLLINLSLPSQLPPAAEHAPHAAAAGSA